jgi:hypothetical protein
MDVQMKYYNYVVYGLVDPDTHLVRYIGAARTKALKQRFSHHISDAKRHPSKSRKTEWIFGLVLRGLLPELRIMEQCHGWNIEECEQKWIRQLRSPNNLTNDTQTRIYTKQFERRQIESEKFMIESLKNQLKHWPKTTLKMLYKRRDLAKLLLGFSQSDFLIKTAAEIITKPKAKTL